MARPRDIEDTIKAGERNRETMRLVHNWCAHARVSKCGGTGIIEAETGLPIGLHMMGCCFAPAGGIACWDIRDSVIDFYDRNCSNCQHRKPVTLPNISEIISARDQEVRAQRSEEANRVRRAAESLKIRDRAREELKGKLDPIGRTILDDIAAYDREQSKENLGRLEESARLAPERFGPPLISYLFALSEQQPWFTSAGINILKTVKADPARLAKLSIDAVSAGHRSECVLVVLTGLVEHVNATSVAKALPMVVDLASPDYTIFLADPPQPQPALLLALWAHHPQALLAQFERMLSSGRWKNVECVGRGLGALQRHWPNAGETLTETLVSTFMRAHLLIRDFDEQETQLPHLADAINSLFECAPENVDRILQRMATGSDRRSSLRAYLIYARVLQARRADDLGKNGSRAYEIALSRLIWAPTTVGDESVTEAMVSFLRYPIEPLVVVARNQIDALLGATLLLADRLDEIANEPQSSSETLFATITRQNRASAIQELISGYLNLAAKASQGSEVLVQKFMAIFDVIPEHREELRGLVLGTFEHFSTEAGILSIFLPHIYHGMVGPSSLIRHFAATALGNLRNQARSNVPDLLYEAFCVLLHDPYVIVHQAALRAFRRSAIPEKYRLQAAYAILNLIFSYRTQSNQERFLVECVRVLAGMADLFGQSSKKIRSYLVEVAMEIEPNLLRGEMRSLKYSLGTEPSFAKLVARMIPTVTDRFNTDDTVPFLLDALNQEGIQIYASDFVKAGSMVAPDDLLAALYIIDALGRAGARGHVLQLSEAVVSAFDDTIRSRAMKIASGFPLLAARFEEAVAADDETAILKIEGEWREYEQIREAMERDSEERYSRGSLFSSN